MPNARLTKLDAVNDILSALGHRQVTTIQGTTSQHARNAVNMLNQADRMIQLQGWSFNYLPEVTYSVDASNGFVYIPDNVVQFTVPFERQYQIRGNRVFDRSRNTYVIETALTGSAKVLLDFDELPEAAKNYITRMAARSAYDKFIGSDETRQTLYAEEVMARQELVNYDAETASYTMLDHYSQPRLCGSDYVPGTIRNDPLT